MELIPLPSILVLCSGGRGSVDQSYPTLCDPMGCSMPGFPVLYYLLEFAQTHTMTPSNHLMLCAPQASPLKHLHLMDSGRGS